MKFKDVILIAGILLAGIGFPLAVLYVALPFAAMGIYIDIFFHMVMMVGIGWFAGVLSFVMYRAWQYYDDPRLFILALFLSLTALSSVIHGGIGILIPDLSLHLVLYLASPFMLVVFLPPALVQRFFYRHNIRIIISGMLFMVIVTSFLIITVSLFGAHQIEWDTSIFIPSLGIVLWISALRFLIPRMAFSLSTTMSILVWGTASLLTAFYHVGDSIWWYFHAMIVSSMLILMIGVVHRRHEIGRMVAPFPIYSGIGKKIILTLLSLTLLFVIIAIVSYRIASQDIYRQIRMDLQQIAYVIDKRTEIAIDLMLDRTSDFSSDWHIRELTEKISHGDSDAGFQLSKYLRHQKQFIDPHNIHLISVVDLNNRVVASTDESTIGAFIDPSLAAAEEIQYGQSSYVGPTPGKTESGGIFHIFSPLYDIERTERFGMIYNQISAESIFDIFTEKGDSERTPSYIVNTESILITPLSHGRIQFASIIDTVPILSCRQGNNHYSGAYTNDIGQQVDGASRCLSNGWVIVTEMTKQESRAGLTIIGRIVAIATIIAVLLIFLLAYGVARTMILPLQRITRFANELRNGNLVSRITIRGSDEIAELATNLNMMADQLQHNIDALKDLDRAKSEFISIASHQLGTPITVLRWNIELLSDQLKKRTKQSARNTLTVLEQTTERMDRLVSDLLNVSRIEQKKIVYEYEEVSLCALARSCCTEIKVAAKQKSISIKLKCDKNVPVLLLDERRTRDILMNLLSNAIKFNRPKGVISIDIQSQKNNALVSVRDTGIGIPLQDQQRLFTKFFRASNLTSYSEAGTGLGLYIVKRYTEGQGGNISFASTEGVGTVFTLSFPFKREAIPTKAV